MGYQNIALAIMLGLAIRAVYSYFRKDDSDEQRKRRQEASSYYNRRHYEYYNEYDDYEYEYYDREEYIPPPSVSASQGTSRQQTSDQRSISLNNTQRNIRTVINSNYQTGYQKPNDTKRLVHKKKKRVRKVKTCSICLNNIKKNCRTLVDCGHKFHAGCITMWLSENQTCPNCRMNTS